MSDDKRAMRLEQIRAKRENKVGSEMPDLASIFNFNTEDTEEMYRTPGAVPDGVYVPEASEEGFEPGEGGEPDISEEDFLGFLEMLSGMLAEAVPDGEEEGMGLLAISKHQLAQLHKSNGEYAQAREEFLEAQRLFSELQAGGTKDFDEALEQIAADLAEIESIL